MKRTLITLLGLSLCSLGYGQKITALPANTSPVDADLTIVVDDVAGTPATQKITLATLKTYFQTGLGDMNDLVDDTTPQLGGGLDVNGNSIVSASNGDIAITPNGTGDLILDGLKWPQADGTADYVIKTDGSGQLSFTANTGTGLANVVDDTTPQLGGDLDLNGSNITGLTASRALNTNGSGVLEVSAVTETELGYLDGVTSAVQTQLDAKNDILNATSAMAALTVDVTELYNTKSISSDSTLLFSTTPTAGQSFGLLLTETGASGNLTVTLNTSCYSIAGGGTITTFTLPESSKAYISWYYDGSVYNIFGEPYLISDLTDVGTPATDDLLLIEDTSAGTNKWVDIASLPSGGGDVANPMTEALDAGGYDITNGGVIFMTEQAAAEADVSGKGQLWVHTAGALWFTDDAGTDTQVSVASMVKASAGFGTDNVLIRSDSTSRNVQHTGVVIDDNDSISGATIPTDDNEIGVATFSYSSDQTLTAAQCYGSTIYVTGTCDITLPPILVEMSVTIIADGAVTVSIVPDATGTTDTLRLDASDLTAGYEADSGGTAAEMAVLTYHSADKWYVGTDGWSDGGAAD